MKKVNKLVALLMALTLVFVMAGCKKKEEKEVYKIGILQQLEHQALDAATEGFKQALIDLLGEENVDFDYQNAQNEPTNCASIATKFVNDKDMDLFERVSEDIKKAMLAREKVRLEALRGAKKEFLEAKTAKGANGELSDETATKIIMKMVKQRKESANIYKENGRPELADNELAEAAVLEEYLPKQLTAEELDAELRAIIAEVGATSPKDMGKVMGVASKRLAGRAEGRAISAAVKALLA